MINKIFLVTFVTMLSAVVSAGYLNHRNYQNLSDLEINNLIKIYERYDNNGELNTSEMIRIEDFLRACDNTAEEQERINTLNANDPTRDSFLQICMQVEGETK